ncbi:MAG: hypothetical protein V8Q82_09525 [Christensenellales bacterium]
MIPRVYVAPVTQGSDTDESRMLPVTFGGDFACKMAAGEALKATLSSCRSSAGRIMPSACTWAI